MRSLRGTVLPLGPRLGAAVAVLGLLSRPAALPVAAATTAPPAMKLFVTCPSFCLVRSTADLYLIAGT